MMNSISFSTDLFRRARRAAIPALLLAVAALAVPRGPAWAYTVYGYEDALGMLHLSRSKPNEKYRLLYEHSGPGLSKGYKGVVAALKDRGAIEEPPVLSLKDVMALVGEGGRRIMAVAEPWLGAPYRLGGDGPGGVDCSGFVKAVFARLGRDMPRQSRLQAGVGVPVEPEAVRPGDLLFFAVKSPGMIDHVAIALEGGAMIHASSRAGGVVVQRWRGTAYQNWLAAARRVPPPGLAVSENEDGRRVPNPKAARP